MRIDRLLLAVALTVAAGCREGANTHVPPVTDDDVLPGDGDGDSDPAPRVDWARLHHPAAHTGDVNTPLDVYGRVFAAGVTNAAGQGPGIEAEVGVGLATDAVESWTWSVASFNVDADEGANDEYAAAVSLPSAPGTYAFAYRFRLDGGPWTYADADGTDNGFDLAQAGKLTVQTPQLPTVDWCELRWPTTMTVPPGATTPDIYGRAFEPGVTDIGVPTGIESEVGFGPSGSTPNDAWSWTTGAFANNLGNNDEHVGHFAVPATEGAFDYAFRFRLAGDASAAWLLCDTNGSTDGYSPDYAGTLTVATPLLDWGVLASAAVTMAAGVAGSAVDVEIYEPGVTNAPGAPQGVRVDVGFGPLGTNPAASEAGWSFGQAAYARDSGTNGANDTFALALPASIPVGSYAVVARVTLDGGAHWVWLDADPSTTIMEAAKMGRLDVVERMVHWCALGRPLTLSLALGASTPNIIGKVYETGITDGGDPSGVQGEVGWGAAGTLPDESWSWTPATFATHVQNDDEHQASFTAPSTSGSYDYAYRFRVGASGAWRVCDADGSDNGYAPASAGKLSVAVPYVDWGVLRPASASFVAETTPPTFEIELYAQGVTNASGAGSGLLVQVGVGPRDTDPTLNATGWNFAAATYDRDSSNNDIYKYIPAMALAVGDYGVVARASLDGGGHWLYLDTDGGTVAFDPAAAGTLSVLAATVGWAKLDVLSAAGVMAVGPSDPIYVEVPLWTAGLTPGAGQGPGVSVEVGLGTRGTEPGTASWQFTPATYGRDAEGAGMLANDVYVWRGAAPGSAGDYDLAARARVGTGAWKLIDRNDTNDGYASANALGVTVMARAAGDIWCTIQWVDGATSTADPVAVRAGEPTAILFGQVYVAGVTGGSGTGPAFRAEVGFGATGSTPSDAWSWSPALFNSHSGNNDEHAARIVPPASTPTQTYDWAFRFSADGGLTWSACDRDGSSDGYTAAQAGILNVTP